MWWYVSLSLESDFPRFGQAYHHRASNHRSMLACLIRHTQAQRLHTALLINHIAWHLSLEFYDESDFAQCDT